MSWLIRDFFFFFGDRWFLKREVIEVIYHGYYALYGKMKIFQDWYRIKGMVKALNSHDEVEEHK